MGTTEGCDGGLSWSAILAAGQWLDRDVKCGPRGTKDDTFHVGELIHHAASIWGKAETLVGKVTGNEEADFRGTKREEDKPWFALVGAIANGGQPKADGTPAHHQTKVIGESAVLDRIEHEGYLYAFANDAWGFYENNRGSVELMVERLS